MGRKRRCVAVVVSFAVRCDASRSRFCSALLYEILLCSAVRDHALLCCTRSCSALLYEIMLCFAQLRSGQLKPSLLSSSSTLLYEAKRRKVSIPGLYSIQSLPLSLSLSSSFAVRWDTTTYRLADPTDPRLLNRLRCRDRGGDIARVASCKAVIGLPVGAPHFGQKLESTGTMDPQVAQLKPMAAAAAAAAAEPPALSSAPSIPSPSPPLDFDLLFFFFFLR